MWRHSAFISELFEILLDSLHCILSWCSATACSLSRANAKPSKNLFMDLSFNLSFHSRGRFHPCHLRKCNFAIETCRGEWVSHKFEFKSRRRKKQDSQHSLIWNQKTSHEKHHPGVLPLMVLVTVMMKISWHYLGLTR